MPRRQYRIRAVQAICRYGDSEPYKTNTIELNLPTLTGKLNGEGESVVIAPEGLKSVGLVYDEAVVEDGLITKIIKRVGVVDLGTLNWNLNSTGFFAYYPNDAANISSSNRGDHLICSQYASTNNSGTSMPEKTIGGTGGSSELFFVKDSSYSDTATFKSAMDGILLYYELAEPITYVLDEPIAAAYNIEKGGTESVISEDSEGKDAALFIRDIAYPQPSDLNMASLLPDFDHLTPVEVIEYNVARSGFCLLYNRANPSGTKASDVTDVVAFRLTVTGADMQEKQVISVMVMLSGRQNTYANGFLNANTPDVSAAGKYGIYQLRQYAPKVLGSGYGWGMEFNTYTANERHIKIEVFKKTSAIEFYKVQTASSVNSANYIYVATNVDTFRPLMSLAANIAGSATSAAYVNGYMPAFTGTAVFIAGEALTTNDLAFMSTDGKSYKIGTKNKPIRPEAGIIVIGTNFNANTGIGYAYTRKITSGIAFTSISAERDTFDVNDEVFLRCTMANGELYSDGYLSNTMSAGYTWISVGIAYAATSVCINTMGKEFLTLDSQGRLTHINGKEIAVPSIENSLFKRGVVSQTITWAGGTGEKKTYTISDIVFGIIPQTNIELFVSAGAIFNETTGYFELGDSTDIAYDEMQMIYRHRPVIYCADSYYSSTLREILPSKGTTAAVGGLFYGASRIRYIPASIVNSKGGSYPHITNYGGSCFSGCTSLRRVDLSVYGSSTANISNANMFLNCYELEYVYIPNLTRSIVFSSSPKITIECLSTIVRMSNATAAITITLHATAYARCQADTTEYTYNEQTYVGIIAYAVAKNITIESA